MKKQKSNKFKYVVTHIVMAILCLLFCVLGATGTLIDYVAVIIELTLWAIASIYMLVITKKMDAWWKHVNAEEEYVSKWLVKLQKRAKRNVNILIYFYVYHMMATSISFVFLTLAIAESELGLVAGCLFIIVPYLLPMTLVFGRSQMFVLTLTARHFQGMPKSFAIAKSIIAVEPFTYEERFELIKRLEEVYKEEKSELKKELGIK